MNGEIVSEGVQESKKICDLLDAHRKEETQLQQEGLCFADAFGLKKPRTYISEVKDLKSFLEWMKVKNQERQIFDEKQVRRLWAGSFANNSLEECVESLCILRDQVQVGFQTGTNGFLFHAENTDWKFYKPYGNVENKFKSETDSPLLQFERNQYIMLVNMVSGLPYAPLILEASQKLNREPAAYILAGYSKNGHTRFEDGTMMYDALFIPPAELGVLMRNREKAVVVLDDTEADGVSYGALRRTLGGMGFEKIYKIVSNQAWLLDKSATRVFQHI